MRAMSRMPAWARPFLDYVYQPRRKDVPFEQALATLATRIPNEVRRGPVPFTEPASVSAVLEGFASLGIPVESWAVDADDYHRYVERAGYQDRHGKYYPDNRLEKTFEHYVVFRFSEFSDKSVFVDLAAESSPLASIVERLTGATTYRQDIMFRAGIRGRDIGGDACAMPVADGFATSAALTCSIEHFERDADSRLFTELARVLRPGGRVVVIPLYLFPEPAAQTDPTYSIAVDVPFDREAVVYSAEGWGNRHGRFYSPATLAERLLKNPAFDFRVLHLTGTEALGTGVYARYALVGERRAG
jgi:hypothetical protein